jgi:UPF0755 protein
MVLSEQQPTQPSLKKFSKKLRLVLILGSIFLGLVVLVSAVAGGLFYHTKIQFETAGLVAPAGGEFTIFDVPLGQGVVQIAEQLEQEGLIRNALIFRLGVVWYRSENKLRAGEYAIPAGASMIKIMEILREGKVVLYKLTIPEGLTSAQVVRLIEGGPNLLGDVGEMPSEGSLLPETYFFPRGTTRRDLVERMKQSQDSVLTELWGNRAKGLPITTPNEAVILASIVEKETGIAEERPRIASVFINRLKKRMRLASDPTIIYGLTGGEPMGRGIRQSELKKITPYNTYEIDGLPPTPIANPGRDALAAVLNPPETKDLYFVADGTGGHLFASSYREHQRNVASWRRFERQKGNSQ